MRKGAILLVVLSILLVACRASTAEPTVLANQPDGGSPPTAISSTPTTTASTTPSTIVAEDPTEAEVKRQLAILERELEALEAEQERLMVILDGEYGYPIEMVDDRGPVMIPNRPERIVSLSATHTEILYAVGAEAQIVATDLTSNYPPAAVTTDKVDSFSFSIEAIVALQPDLVLLAFDFQGEVEALTALGIPFLLLGPPDTLESAILQTMSVGVATGHFDEARALGADMFEAADLLENSAAPIGGLTIFHEVDETLYSATSATFIGDLYHRLGLVNIADGAQTGSPFPQLTSEFIVDQNPDFIFLADANFGVTPAAVADRPGWDTIQAVVDDNIVELDGDIAGRWGPRTIDLMESILNAVAVRVP